jgi:hypothetical protein
LPLRPALRGPRGTVADRAVQFLSLAWDFFVAFLRAARKLGGELLRALAPLFLPALVLALVVVARALPLKVALPVIVTAVYLAVRYVIRRDWADVPVAPHAVTTTLYRWSSAALERAPGTIEVTREQTRPAAGVLVFLALTAVCSLAAVLVSPTFWSSVWLSGRGRWPTALAEGAFVIGGGALLLRLAAFCRSWSRTLLAVALLVLSARVVIYAGLLPFQRNFQWMSPRNLAFAAAASFVLCAVVAVAIGGGRRIGRSRLVILANGEAFGKKRAKWLAGLGLYVSLLSSAALLFAVLAGIYFISHRGIEDASRARAAPIVTELPNADMLRPKDLTDEDLARTYMPVFVYSNEQRWLPVPVGSYLEEASLVTPGHTLRHAPSDASALPGACRPNIAPPCYGLTIDCEQGNESCAQASLFDPDGTLHRERTVYVRVLRTEAQLHRSPEAMNEAQIAFEHKGPFEDKQLQILVQYWLFYRYDEWSAPTIFGRLVQRHEGDWEAITIGFSPHEPLFVAYSAHCTGQWEYWKNIHVAADLDLPTHPLVAVAEGSQANYDNSQERRPPDWASCLGIDGTAFAALSYIWGIEDVTGDDYRLMPTDIRLVDSDKPPMAFPGRWGENARTVIHNFRTFRLGPEGVGPPTPSLQALWIDPLTTIFCSWRPRMCGLNARPAAERALVAPLDEP